MTPSMTDQADSRTMSATGNGSAQPEPLIRPGREVLPAGTCQAIEAGTSVVVGSAPLRLNPAALLEALQGRVEGAMVNQERPTGLELDGTGDPLAVLLAEGQDAQNQ